MPRHPSPKHPKCEQFWSPPNLDAMSHDELHEFAARYLHANNHDAAAMLGCFPGFAKQARLMGSYAIQRASANANPDPSAKLALEAICEELYGQLKGPARFRPGPRELSLQIGQLKLNSVMVDGEFRTAITSLDSQVTYLDIQSPDQSHWEHIRTALTTTLTNLSKEKL